MVTSGQSHWFGTSYGADGYRGGGSNMTTWIPGRDRITWTRLLPDSHADARFDASLPDHEELVYAPELARGGTQLCALDPDSGDVEEITDAEEGRWDYHASWSAAGDAVVFSRARVTEPPELWDRRCRRFGRPAPERRARPLGRRLRPLAHLSSSGKDGDDDGQHYTAAGR